MFIGRFVMSQAKTPAYLLAVTHEGGVDWHFQMMSDQPGNWEGPRLEGWERYTKIIPGGGGVFYGLAPDGDLDWFKHSKEAWRTGEPKWNSPFNVGTGWGTFLHVVPTGFGVLYGIRPDGKALWYRHGGLMSGKNAWSGPIEVGSGFEDYLRIFSVGNGVIYGVRWNGDLIWHVHEGWKDGKVAWTPSRKVGTG